MKVSEYTVPDSLASNAHTVESAVEGAHAVSSCRVIIGMLLGSRFPLEVDAKLHDLELAYYRRADVLQKSAKVEPKLWPLTCTECGKPIDDFRSACKRTRWNEKKQRKENIAGSFHYPECPAPPTDELRRAQPKETK